MTVKTNLPKENSFRYSWHSDLTETASPKDRYRIAVIGIGEAGNRLTNTLSKAGLGGTDFIRLQPQPQKIRKSPVTATKNLEKKKRTDTNEPHDSNKTPSEFDIVFLAASMNAWKGGGAARIVANDVRSKGTIVIGVVTLHAGLQDKYADTLAEIQNSCDTALIVETDKLQGIVPRQSQSEANGAADQITANTVKGMIEAIATPSLISYDWTDFKTFMRRGGIANVGIGESSTPNRVQEAVRNALNSPSLGLDHWEPTGALVHVTGDNHMTIEEANRVGETVTEMMGPNTTVIWGARVKPEQQRRLKVTLVVTGRASKKTSKALDRIAPRLFNLETQDEQEGILSLDLGLYQMESP